MKDKFVLQTIFMVTGCTGPLLSIYLDGDLVHKVIFHNISIIWLLPASLQGKPNIISNSFKNKSPQTQVDIISQINHRQ